MTGATRREALAGGLALVALPAAAARAEDGRVADLLGRMTIEEKAGQLNLVGAAVPADTVANPEVIAPARAKQIADIEAGRVGALYNALGQAWHREAQLASQRSRLRIPLLFAADVIHGYRTIFPVGLGEAASFDPALAERTSRAAADEASTNGMAWSFAPMVDVARDPRWGRGVEGAGEDVLLSRRMAAARVRGFQGAGLTRPDAVAATTKHFAAYGAAATGIDYREVDISERTLREIYLPPFKAGLDAGAATLMAAFHDLNGVPCHANRWLLVDLLRREWGFDGLVVSDYDGDLELIAHGRAADAREAATIALMAGVDMCLHSELYLKHIPGLVAAGEVPVARVDEAVARTLRLKARLGLLDAPMNRFVRPELARPAYRPLAREAGRRSVVLLRNEGGLLPLAKSARVALIGPFATGTAHLHGPWTLAFADHREAVPLDAGLRAAGVALTVTPGSHINAALPGGIEAAVAAARAADVVVLAIGEGQDMSGEAKSRDLVVVPAPQRALAEAVAATGKPVVVVLRHGRALALDGAVAAAPAILAGWFLGTETGPALADILLGDAAPEGRLPVSFPRSAGQVPFHYADKASGRPPLTNRDDEIYRAKFIGVPDTPLFPFGHGLTYGEMVYGPVEAGSGALPWDGALTVRARVTNRGARAGVEVAQLYVRDVAASVTRPVRELKDWRRLALGPGASALAEFTLTRADLAFLGPDLRPVAEPGAFDVWIAPSAGTGASARVTLAR